MPGFSPLSRVGPVNVLTDVLGEFDSVRGKYASPGLSQADLRLIIREQQQQDNLTDSDPSQHKPPRSARQSYSPFRPGGINRRGRTGTQDLAQGPWGRRNGRGREGSESGGITRGERLKRRLQAARLRNRLASHQASAPLSSFELALVTFNTRITLIA